MLKRFLLSLSLLFVALGGVSMPTPAWADNLATAKTQGLVGEQADGLLGIVTTPTAELKALVSDVNTRRLALFAQIAAKNGQSLDAVKAVSGEEFMNRTPAGQYIRTPQGTWQKK